MEYFSSSDKIDLISTYNHPYPREYLYNRK